MYAASPYGRSRIMWCHLILRRVEFHGTLNPSPCLFACTDPTLKYYNPGDVDGAVYEGERDYKSLEKFAKSLGPQCGPGHLKKCTEDQKAAVEQYMSLPMDELSTALAQTEAKLTEATAKHDELMKSLQEQYKASEAGLKQLKEEHEPMRKLMKTVLAHRSQPVDQGTSEAPPKAEL